MKREDFIKRALVSVVNDMGETRYTRENSIVFPNGWVASVVENTSKRDVSDKKYSLAVCDYNGYFNWQILNEYGAINGCLYCDNEEEICSALAIVESL